MRSTLFFAFTVAFILLSCKEDRKEIIPTVIEADSISISYAKGFLIDSSIDGVTILKINSPWPNADIGFKYALISKDKMATMTLNKDEYDAIISVPVERIVVTSTTHIPALESLEVLDKIVGFPETDYISSKEARKRIDKGLIKELGNNEAINTEMVIELNPDVVVGFSIDNANKIYETIQRSNIPVVYNGDWTEETPLGKAEWIKFFAPFFQLEDKAETIFSKIETSYLKAKQLAQGTEYKPTVLSGALYKDVWYAPGGDSWAAQFLMDANVNYLWKETQETGSLSLSIESVLEKGKNADFWVSPSQFTSYRQLGQVNNHYRQFNAYKHKNVYTFANTIGETGGLLYYELAPQRPDLVLKDLIYIFHPELLPEHTLFFFKPLE